MPPFTHTCRNCSRSFGGLSALRAHWGLCAPKGSGRAVEPSELDFETLSLLMKKEVLLKETSSCCSLCGFSATRSDGKTILELDHVDGNPRNNVRENLRILCPNCHALTPTFRNLGRVGKSSPRLRRGNRGHAEYSASLLVDEDERRNELERELYSVVLATLDDSSVNYSKSGWVTQLHKEFTRRTGRNVTSKTIGVYVRRTMPDFYNSSCFRRS